MIGEGVGRARECRGTPPELRFSVHGFDPDLKNLVVRTDEIDIAVGADAFHESANSQKSDSEMRDTI